MKPEKNGIPIEFYNSYEWPAHWKFKPNGDMRRCQCVMDHSTMRDGDMWQCTGSRAKGSDLYCEGCERDHGKAHIAALAEKEEEARR